MKSVAGIILAAAVMLSACGGGSSNSDASSNLNSQSGPTPVTQESQAIAAPQQIVVGSTQFKATAWMQTVNSTLPGHAIPADQQAAYLELQADTNVNWSNIKITGLAGVRAGRANVYDLSDGAVQGSSSIPRHAYMFLNNQLNQDYLAIRVQVGAADAQWLRIQNANCACTHRVLSTSPRPRPFSFRSPRSCRKASTSRVTSASRWMPGAGGGGALGTGAAGRGAEVAAPDGAAQFASPAVEATGAACCPLAAAAARFRFWP